MLGFRIKKHANVKLCNLIERIFTTEKFFFFFLFVPYHKFPKVILLLVRINFFFFSF